MQYDLKSLAKQAMRLRGLEPDFSKEALAQLEQVEISSSPNAAARDLRSFLFCSIDNDDSKDLDQLTHAEKNVLWVAVADVDALVAKDSPIDQHARKNTTSVYTPAKIFPMLPEKLSTDLTSLNENEDRMAIVIEVHVSDEGNIESGAIFQALVRNHAKLTYGTVGDWLEGKIEVPEKIKAVKGLQESLERQHSIAQLLQHFRHKMGALTLEPNQFEAKLGNNLNVILQLPLRNFAQQLIENFMIAANHVIASRLRKMKIPSLRRVVRIPKRWDRLIEIAASYQTKLPQNPDSKALEHFLTKRKAQDPTNFPDLSLTVIKLLGRGEYIVENPGDAPVGHFGLALSEYVHSTAPNRRFPDLISQRQVKAHLQGRPSPYTLEELQDLAVHCTAKEDAATKVERHMKKVAAALFLAESIGSQYEGLITGAGPKGTWVRVHSPPVEGRLIRDGNKLDVGDKVVVELVSVDIPNGYINFSLC